MDSVGRKLGNTSPRCRPFLPGRAAGPRHILGRTLPKVHQALLAAHAACTSAPEDKGWIHSPGHEPWRRWRPLAAGIHSAGLQGSVGLHMWGGRMFLPVPPGRRNLRDSSPVRLSDRDVRTSPGIKALGRSGTPLEEKRERTVLPPSSPPSVRTAVPGPCAPQSAVCGRCNPLHTASLSDRCCLRRAASALQGRNNTRAAACSPSLFDTASDSSTVL